MLLEVLLASTVFCEAPKSPEVLTVDTSEGPVVRGGDLFHEPAVPPDRLSFVRTSFDLDRARQVAARAEQLRTAPVVEQPRGGTQHQFFRPGHDTPLSQRELEDLDVLGWRAA